MSKEYQSLRKALITVQTPKLSNKEYQEAWKEISRVHARYNVPYMSRAGLTNTLTTYNPPHVRGGRSRLAAGGGGGGGPPSRGSTTISSSTVGVPAAVGAIVRMAPTAQKGTLIHHSELFGSVVGTSAFTLTAYQVNPGLADLFPWLAKIAHNYDLYSLRRVTISYKVLTGTDTEGAVYIGYDPDALDTPPTTKSQLMSFGSSVSGPVWREITFTLPNTSKGTRYIRRGYVANSTLHTYDAGIFYIATENCPAQALGDLYITYDVELSLPHVVSADYGHFRTQHITSVDNTVDASSLVGTLPHTSRGDIIVNPAATTYPAAKSVTFVIAEADSYDDAGVRKWTIVFSAAYTGTGIASMSVASSDSTATKTALSYIVMADGTKSYERTAHTYTRDPVGSTLTLSLVCTTVTSDCYTFYTSPGVSHVSEFD